MRGWRGRHPQRNLHACMRMRVFCTCPPQQAGISLWHAAPLLPPQVGFGADMAAFTADASASAFHVLTLGGSGVPLKRSAQHAFLQEYAARLVRWSGGGGLWLGEAGCGHQDRGLQSSIILPLRCRSTAASLPPHAPWPPRPRWKMHGAGPPPRAVH